jgi:hypothetical protein
MNGTLAEGSVLQVEAIIELLEVCPRTTYFQVDDKFFQQKDGMAMGSSWSLIVSNICVEHFEKLALDSAQHKASLWLQYVDDTFVGSPHRPERLQYFLSHLSSLRPSIQFTMEIESDSAIPFLNVLVVRKETTLTTKVRRKPIHTARYLNLRSNHPSHVERSLIQSLHNRASTICQEQDLCNEISSLRHDLRLSDVPKVALSQLLIPRVAVVQIKRKSL